MEPAAVLIEAMEALIACLLPFSRVFVGGVAQVALPALSSVAGIWGWTAAVAAAVSPPAAAATFGVSFAQHGAGEVEADAGPDSGGGGGLRVATAVSIELAATLFWLVAILHVSCNFFSSWST